MATDREDKPAQSHASVVKAFDRWKVPPQYQLKQVIGTGAYGSVSEAYDTSRRQLVAIKRVAHLFDDLVDCKRILREISILSKLRHDYIVRIYDVVPNSDVYTFDQVYIVMEICDSDLKKLCRTDVVLSPLHINTLLYNLLVGLRYLHSAGIYHRDLKPANCLVNQDCSVKICDFGLSRAIWEEEPQQPGEAAPPGEAAAPGEGPPPPTTRVHRSLTGHVVTRWYRAPELILLEENYTEAIDMWSVGCIYAELTGMLEGTKMEDRGPLFPGSSCFPLSPDQKRKGDQRSSAKGKHDQLNMIFNLIGTPSASEVQQLERSDAKRYIQCFAPRPGEGISARFAHVEADAQDILESMLRFSPTKRIAVAEALRHELFTDVRVPEKEKLAAGPISLPFEKEPDLDEPLLRRYFCREIQKYRTADLAPESRRRGGA